VFDIEIVPQDTWATDRIHELLDSRFWTVSSDAFQRHGEVQDVIECTLNFRVITDVENTVTSSKTAASDECPICNGDPPQTLAKYAIRDPLPSGSKYHRPLKKSHHLIDCFVCEGIETTVCDECNGNGRSNCRQCSGTGRRTYKEQCDMCDGAGMIGSTCPECDGEGNIAVERVCKNCRGEGHTQCLKCRGEGVTVCSQCDGEGQLHKYDQTEFEVKYEVRADGLPSVWKASPEDLLERFNPNQEDWNVRSRGKRRVILEMNPVACNCVSLRYDESQYNVLLAIDYPENEAIWDSETSYPKTSVRRKISDLKSRLF
jgi:hypothetical protein